MNQRDTDSDTRVPLDVMVTQEFPDPKHPLKCIDEHYHPTENLNTEFTRMKSEQKLSLEAWGSYVGTRRQTLAGYLKDAGKMPYDCVLKTCQLFNTTISYLRFGESRFPNKTQNRWEQYFGTAARVAAGGNFWHDNDYVPPIPLDEEQLMYIYLQLPDSYREIVSLSIINLFRVTLDQRSAEIDLDMMEAAIKEKDSVISYLMQELQAARGQAQDS